MRSISTTMGSWNLTRRNVSQSSRRPRAWYAVTRAAHGVAEEQRVDDDGVLSHVLVRVARIRAECPPKDGLMLERVPVIASENGVLRRLLTASSCRLLLRPSPRRSCRTAGRRPYARNRLLPHRLAAVLMRRNRLLPLQLAASVLARNQLPVAAVLAAALVLDPVG
jgi:hypothetical protein